MQQNAFSLTLLAERAGLSTGQLKLFSKKLTTNLNVTYFSFFSISGLWMNTHLAFTQGRIYLQQYFLLNMETNVIGTKSNQKVPIFSTHPNRANVILNFIGEGLRSSK